MPSLTIASSKSWGRLLTSDGRPFPIIRNEDAAKVVHRDLKPDNVFLVADGEETLVKVLDFGVTKALTAPELGLTHTGALLGTPLYASPEQVEGKAVDGRSDLWSLGVMTFECLTGEMPFYGPSLPKLLSARDDRRQEARIPSSIPAGINRRRDLQHTALIHNASRSGALLLTRHTCAPGQQLLLTVHLQSADLGEELTVRVVRVLPHSDQVWKLAVGVHFMTPPSEGLMRRLESRARAERG